MINADGLEPADCAPTQSVRLEDLDVDVDEDEEDAYVDIGPAEFRALVEERDTRTTRLTLLMGSLDKEKVFRSFSSFMAMCVFMLREVYLPRR